MNKYIFEPPKIQYNFRHYHNLGKQNFIKKEKFHPKIKTKKSSFFMVAQVKTLYEPARRFREWVERRSASISARV